MCTFLFFYANITTGIIIMKIYIVQYQSNCNLSENLKTAKSILGKVTQKHCDLVVFPELFL